MRGEIYGLVSSLGLLATAVILTLHARFVYLTGKDLQGICLELDRALERLRAMATDEMGSMGITMQKTPDMNASLEATGPPEANRE